MNRAQAPDTESSPEARYRVAALRSADPSPWVDRVTQQRSLGNVLHNVRQVRAAGLRPVVALDLDLTTLLAPEVAASKLREIASVARGLEEVVRDGAAQLGSWLEAQWRNAGTSTTLLPGYTDGAIEGYGRYILAVGCRELDANLPADTLVLAEEWVRQQVHTVLRNGYWDRDPARDMPAPGLVDWLGALLAAGGEPCFLSNRPIATRAATLQVLRDLMTRVSATAPLYLYLGPGGSAYDALAKQVAVRHLEQGATAGVYVADIVQEDIRYPASEAAAPAVLTAVFDDRARNRAEIVEAAERSRAALAESGGVLAIVAVPWGHTPEVDVVVSPLAIATFET